MSQAQLRVFRLGQGAAAAAGPCFAVASGSPRHAGSHARLAPSFLDNPLPPGICGVQGQPPPLGIIPRSLPPSSPRSPAGK